MKIAYYVSGHGFGHATRTIPIVNALVDVGVFVYFCKYKFMLGSPHNPSLFDKDFLNKVHFRKIANSGDGVVQKDALTIDVEATIEKLNNYDFNHWIVEEQEWIKDLNVNLIVSDALFLVGGLSKYTGIPSVIISNFLWDSIYEGLGVPILESVIDHYKQCRLWLKQPGWIPSPSLNDRYVDVPGVFRKPKSRNREKILKALTDQGWSNNILLKLTNSKILLVSFGGHALMEGIQVNIPSGWFALIMNGNPNENQTNLLAVNGSHPSIYLPDLTFASHGILGKLGYGTCGECIACGNKPMIYVPREGFIEEQGLIKMMQDYNKNRITKLDLKSYQLGDWSAAIEIIDGFSPIQDENIYDGELTIANLLTNLATTL